MNWVKEQLKQQSDIVLVICMIGILLVLFVPIPSQLLDVLLILNFSFALMILLLTFYVDKPLKFSTFPSLLLIATLFRLSLNIAATRLILGDAYAGQVIDAIGNYVVGGNYVIGLIVFLVLIVVQYVVVTNGAQRVAEVAARFTLDAMPGKQMSIDADMNMGLIDEKEAQERRKEIEKEANFYGAMDGASKFVKGDAIAGIIIILIDIIGGLAIGVSQQDMSWADALQRFTLLTIGDGIVTQIPALIISTGTGIIVTRAASDETLSRTISNQIISFPKVLILISIMLAIFMLLPGMPIVPVMLVLVLTSGLAFFSWHQKNQNDIAEQVEDDTKASSSGNDIYNMMAIDPVEIEVGKNLVPMAGGDESSFMDRIVEFRKSYALDMGFVIPKVRVRDNKRLAPHSYEVSIFSTKMGSGEIIPDRLLAIDPGAVKDAIDGIDTKDPSYGLPAVWIMDSQRNDARERGYTLVDPVTVLMTHLSEILKQQAANLLTRAETDRLLERVRSVDPGLIEELVPSVMSLTDIQKVLQNLLREKVSIRNLEMILESLVDYGKHSKEAEFLTEIVRQKLGSTICQSLAGNGTDLHVLVLDPAVEKVITTGIANPEGQARLILDPQLAEQVLIKLAAQVEKMMRANYMPVLLCAPELRKHLRSFTERVIPHLSVLSMGEVPSSISIKSFGLVAL
ncbi:MAG: flagellar biosynthesis protein FlhA [Candidatus Sedimenticola sp. (ex Thyasira tokunagai)]